jgi:glycosyltransferase involved in cell wall biosynthesis
MVSRGVVSVGRNSGGAEHVAFKLAEYLADRGEEVVLISDADSSMIENTPPNLSIREVRTYSGIGRLVKLVPLDFPRWLFQHLLGNIRAVRRARTILETDEEGFDVVHVHGALTTILLSRKIQFSTGFPLVYTEHDSTPWSCDYRGAIERAVRRCVYRWVNLWACRSATMVVTNFPLLAKELAARTGIPEDHFAVVRNAADTDWSTNHTNTESIKAKYGFDRYFLFVGSLVERKGPDVLIRALSHVNLPCIFVGDGPMRDSLLRLAARAGIADRVVFTGALERREVRDYYSGAETLVLPSVSEGVPLVIIEALSAGVPVIASNLEGIASVVQDRRNGLLVRPGDVASLAQALSEIATDEAICESLKIGALESSKDVEKWTEVANQLCTLYENHHGESGGIPVSRTSEEMDEETAIPAEELVFGLSSTRTRP